MYLSANGNYTNNHCWYDWTPKGALCIEALRDHSHGEESQKCAGRDTTESDSDAENTAELLDNENHSETDAACGVEWEIEKVFRFANSFTGIECIDWRS